MNKLDIKDIPIIDTHIHLTNINDISYKWKNDCPELFKNWTEEQYLKETKNLNIKTGIFVEVAAATPKEELEWIIRDSNNENSIIGGIIAHLSLDQLSAVTLSAKRQVMLEASLLSITKKSLDNLKSDKIVGIRQIFQGETNLTNPFYLDNEYIKSLQLLADKNLVFDICVYADQLSSIITLVEKTPNNKYILDHIGKPFNINNSNNDKWFDNIFQLSKYQNVCCKLSAGFIMKDKTLTEVKIYVNHCIKCFGYDRLVVGSDWFFSESIIKPYDWFKFLLDVFVENHLPEHIIKNIFYDNALKIYSLKTNC